MCAMKKPDADRPKGLEQAEAEEMCSGPKKEEQIEEISAAGGGGLVGSVGTTRDDPDKLVSDGLAPEMTKDLPPDLPPMVAPSSAFDVPGDAFEKIGRKLTEKEEELEEMYSTGGLLTYGLGPQVDEFDGYKEREEYLKTLNEKPHRKRIKVRFKR